MTRGIQPIRVHHVYVNVGESPTKAQCLLYARRNYSVFDIPPSIMYGKVRIFLALFLFCNPSSAFLPDKCRIEFDPTKLYQGNIEPNDIIKGAICVGSLLRDNYGLVKKFPTALNFVENLIQKGTSAVASNPAFFGASIYFMAIVLVSHYHAIDAKKQLLEAQFEQDDLNIAIESEIVPVLKFIETVLISGGSKNGMNGFCIARGFLKEIFNNALDNLQKVRGNIERKMVDSSSGEERSKVLQWLSGGAAGSAGFYTLALAPCAFTAFFACPALMLGTAGAAASGAGYYIFGNTKSEYRQTFDLLEQAKLQAMSVEKALRTARVHVETTCIKLMIDESSVNYNKLEYN